jgi:hypothetical protein
MSYKNYKITNRGKATTKRIGIRSIYDIINQDATDDWKINYIRHRYVYYDGNYDLFHDEEGNPTETKKMLDDIIFGIIKGDLDPSELSTINKEILELRKQKNKEEQEKKNQELEEYIQEKEHEESLEIPVTTQPKECVDLSSYKKGISNAEVYFQLIDEYLLSLPPEERERAAAWPYRDLKKVAKWWKKTNQLKLPPVRPGEIQDQKKAMQALLKGYRAYAATEWKNTEDTEPEI